MLQYSRVLIRRSKVKSMHVSCILKAYTYMSLSLIWLKYYDIKLVLYIINVQRIKKHLKLQTCNRRGLKR